MTQSLIKVLSRCQPPQDGHGGFGGQTSFPLLSHTYEPEFNPSTRSLPIFYGPPTAKQDAEGAKAFRDSTKKGTIRDFDDPKLPGFSEKDSHNNDIKAGRFQRPPRLYAANQRKGVIAEHVESLSLRGHIDKALPIPPFLSLWRRHYTGRPRTQLTSF